MSGTNDAFGGFNVEDAIEILERRRWWIAVGAVFGLALGLFLYLVLPARFESTTTILVEPQGVPESYIKSTITQAVEQRLGTLQERVTSYTSLNELIDRIGIERFDESGKMTREAVMGRIRANLDVQIGSNKRSSAPVFEVTYAAADPELAATVVREIAGLFISENLKDRARQATATAQFLDKELDRLRDDVSEQEERIRRFTFEHMGSLPGQLDSNLRELDRLNVELAGNLERQLETESRLALLRRQVSGGQGDTENFEAAGTLGAMLRKARQDLLEARSNFTDAHPNVQHLMAEVERLKDLIANGPADPSSADLDPAIALLHQEASEQEMALSAHKRQEARIRERIADIEQRVESTPKTEQQEIALTRDYENLVATYRSLLGKKYEAALARNLELAQKGERFKLLRPAQVPTAPAWPDIRLLLPAGLAVGLLLAGLVIAISEFRHPAFRSVDRLTRILGLPVFASIPVIDNDQIFETPPTDDVDPRLVVHTAPESSPAEQYRGFLPAFLDAEDCRVILVTSAARGDGKTLTAMNLAATLATDLNKKVLVIDGDLRRPRVHRIMRSGRSLGLSNVLQNEVGLPECTENSKIPNLTILPAGRSVRNPLTLLTNDTFLKVIEEAKASYDVILIDSPPLLPVVDSKILRKIADMVLFVVRADATPRDAVVRSMQELNDVAGVVFNQVSPGSFRRYYYYDAYSRYAYGDPVDGLEEVAEATAGA